MFVLNVIGKGAKPAAFQALATGAPAILSEGFAFDLPVTDAAALVAAHTIAGDAPWDINLVPTQNRRKKLLAADMDSTVVTVEILDELAAMAGLGDGFAALTEKTMRGEVDFVGSLTGRVALLKGVKLSLLETVMAEKVRLTPGAKSLVATMQAHGGRSLLITSGFCFFAERVARQAGFGAICCNRLLDDGAVLTGEIARPILDSAGKKAALEKARQGLAPEETLAVGDGANDVAMIQAAGLGVGFRPKPVLAAVADAVIRHNDLTALLYLQGYTEDEIVKT